MTLRHWRGAVGAILPAVILLALCAAQPSRADGRERMLSDWQNRLKRVQSVRYTITGTVDTKSEVLADLLKNLAVEKNVVIPPPSTPKPIKMVVLIDLEGKYFRIDKSEVIFSQASRKYVPRVTTRAYDGKVYQTLIPREQNERDPEDPDIAVSKGNLQQMTVEAFLWPVFAGHGLVSTVNAPLRPDKLPNQHGLDEFELRGVVRHAGRNCTVLRTAPLNAHASLSDEFWVDPGRESAIIRQIYFNGANPWHRLDVDHQETPHGWLPKTWTCTWTSGGRVATVYNLMVESHEFNQKFIKEDFTLPIRPGMIVYADEYPEPGTGLDPNLPGYAKYRVDTSGRWIELKSNGFTTVEGVELPPKSNRIRWLWWIGCGTLIIALGVIVGFRHRNRRPA